MISVTVITVPLAERAAGGRGWRADAWIIARECMPPEPEMRGGELAGRDGINSVTGAEDAGPVCQVRRMVLER